MTGNNMADKFVWQEWHQCQDPGLICDIDFKKYATSEKVIFFTDCKTNWQLDEIYTYLAFSLIKHGTKSALNFIYKSSVINMAMMQNFVIVSDKFNVDRLY